MTSRLFNCSLLLLCLLALMPWTANAARINSVKTTPAPGHFATWEGWHGEREAEAACHAFRAQHPDSHPWAVPCSVWYVNGYHELTLATWGYGWAHIDGPNPFFWYDGFFCRPGARYVPSTDDYSRDRGRCVHVIDRYFGCDPCWVGNPISPLTGQKRQREALGHWLGETFELVYDTREQLPRNLSFTGYLPASPFGFGPLWFGSHHRRLHAMRNAAGVALAVHVGRGGNDFVGFSLDTATGQFMPQVPSGHRLSYNAADNTWHFKDFERQTIDRFDAQGLLRTVSRIDGGTLSFDYSVSLTQEAPEYGLLLVVRDDRGRRVQFSYEKPTGVPSARVRRVTAPDGAVIELAYGANGQVASLQRPGAMPVRYLYEDVNRPWALTGITAEDGSSAGRFTYDNEGRAVSTGHALGADRHAVSWSSPPQWQVIETYDPQYDVYWRDHTWLVPAGTTVETPNGTTYMLEYTVRNAVPFVAARSQSAGAGSSASASSFSHDSNGFTASSVDARGTRTCWQRDALGRETTRIDGAAAAETCADLLGSLTTPPRRRTTTAWHPDWRLPTRVAEPGRVTTYLYHGQPNPLAGNAIVSCTTAPNMPGARPLPLLCATIEQETNDLTGDAGLSAPVAPASVPRIWQRQYNARGQAVLEQGPANSRRTWSFADTASAAHAVGDLLESGNALGHVTRYTRHDAHGQWLEAVDPNGVLTAVTFDSNRRLKTSTIAGATTSYDYSARGDLFRVTDAAGVSVEFTYDAARRLTAVTDSYGNRIVYTLTTSGLREVETVHDPSNVLRRQLSRVFDALGRVERLTGLEIQP